jgi:hypothetical protein
LNLVRSTLGRLWILCQSPFWEMGCRMFGTGGVNACQIIHVLFFFLKFTIFIVMVDRP